MYKANYAGALALIPATLGLNSIERCKLCCSQIEVYRFQVLSVVLSGPTSCNQRMALLLCCMMNAARW